jgi:hypothetical protein
MPDGDFGLIYVPAPSSAVGGYLWSLYGDANTSDLSTTILGTPSAAGTFFTAADPA